MSTASNTGTKGELLRRRIGDIYWIWVRDYGAGRLETNISRLETCFMLVLSSLDFPEVVSVLHFTVAESLISIINPVSSGNWENKQTHMEFRSLL